MFDQTVVVRPWQTRNRKRFPHYPSWGVLGLLAVSMLPFLHSAHEEAEPSDICGYMPVPVPPNNTYLLGRPMEDYGKVCLRNEDCSSGLCGSSCSALNWALDNATSCICPTNVNETEQRCCGCVTNGQYEIHTCPDYPDFARTRENSSIGSGRPKPYNDSSGSNCGWWGNFEWSDEMFEEPALPQIKTRYNSTIAREMKGSKTFGARCTEHHECASGMCGFDCDCANKEIPCSCECLSSWPVLTCCSCFIGIQRKVSMCPSNSITVSVTIGLNTTMLCRTGNKLPPLIPPSNNFNFCKTSNCTDITPFSPSPRYPLPKYAYDPTSSMNNEEATWRNGALSCSDGVQHVCNGSLGYECIL
uniref:Uncharacterized protein n=1 Tax=Norrisiella sphaerica TaxID=552664 RepID=A0A7S2VUD6_9EUKA|mmetsp:Transcript_120/g.150  ORF Transcript_120/g.150 Transcript_120/m.150 type:complete len:359 (+) Transcript_120:101-1177(+)|eukprot:CAMPEP_0184498272 /NCGR_PEP_ID=MMETSP0113_2-20130426/38540_1 /TAXON_ID=91329 /ORGANISM="Norrisiella sphaerica, Strain BC52" /LENGTH=358 /DNA_ID=CAMNT_0026885707 /DNA_START=58 /DNA_END=1134 /DNA_ORIENTATION=-